MKHKHSEETKLKMSLAKKGIPHTVEHNAKVAAANRTPESRLKHRMSRLGAKASESTKAKLRLLKAGNQNMKGHKHSNETKAKMRVARLGYKMSDETKAKVGAYWIGRSYGDKNPAWKGGTSFGPYCPKFNKEFKERVRKFFGYRCVGCGVHQDNCKRSHDVHHVNFDKMQCCNGTKPLFVILCRSCHSKTLHKSDHYEQKYTGIINTTYGGKCYVEKQ